MRLPSGRSLRILTMLAVLGPALGLAAGRQGSRVPSGAWGGAHIALDVTDAGATVTFDCAKGTISAPLLLDRDGRFALAGTFAPERGGPTRKDGERARPARYTGSLHESTLTVAVLLTENSETVGTFTLTRGGAARLVRCQ